MPEWLELELAHRLAPAEAPDALWDRLQSGPSRRPPRRRVWPVAAIVTVMIAAGAMWMVAKGQETPVDLARLATLQLNAAESFDLQTDDPVRIDAWARRSAGLDLRIAPAPGVQVLGARLLRNRGERIASISYRVDGRPAALLIAAALHKGNTPHPGMAIAGADVACSICHRSL